jgi:hypothetical protein
MWNRAPSVGALIHLRRHARRRPIKGQARVGVKTSLGEVLVRIWRGLPLVHVAPGGRPSGGRYQPARTRRVIAVEETALGLVAAGPVAVGLVARVEVDPDHTPRLVFQAS